MHRTVQKTASRCSCQPADPPTAADDDDGDGSGGGGRLE